MIEASQIMTTYNPVKHKEKQNDSIPTNSTTNIHAERIRAMSVHLFTSSGQIIHVFSE